MKNCRIRKLAIATSAVILITGCQMLLKPATSASTKTDPPSKRVKKTVKISPDSIVKTMLDSLQSKNYSAFSKRFNSDLKEQLDQDKFDKLAKGLKKTLGNYEELSYIGSLQKGPFTVYLWKTQFSKLRNSDMLIKLTLSKVDRKIQVFGFDIANN